MAKYSPEVMERVRQTLHLEEGDTSADLDIAAMSLYNVFDRCLSWEGIVNYTSDIKQMVENIYGIKLEEK